ncbi:MAG: ABC transporter permease [Holophagales bacterium]|nr:MAG: ABC transporter permease [Holophagales bacterium]
MSRLARSSLFQLTRARVAEFLREPEAVFWVFFFPVLLAVALGIAFRNKPPEPVQVGIEAGSGAEDRLAALGASRELRAEVLSHDEARRQLRVGKIALVVLATDPPTYWLDPTRPESRLARLEVDAALERAAGREDRFRPAELALDERGSRYIDFLVPGLLGMNLMSTGMWAIGFSLVQQRVGKLLKLFVAAPMKRWQLLAAQVLARLVFLALEVAILVTFAVFALDVPMRGSLAAFALVCLVGAGAFVGVGLLTAARPKTIEGVSGIMNLAMFPMWIGSGVFFSIERFPAAAQPFLRAIPLTALNDALRGVMLEGVGIVAVLPQLANLAIWGGVSFFVALRIFRWQ